ncbi:MAG: purine-nucleoside phosphorylase [Rikenellaceae bacterium]|nr:purine-nucleoside phosphorylase [Rikenellaceae bacterium]
MEIISAYNIVKEGEHSPVKDFAIERTGGFAPQVGIVLGSGLGALTEAVESPIVVPYSSIPGFPAPTVAGHKGNMILGVIAGRRVAVMDGRFHYYEGHPSPVTTLPVRLMAAMGVKTLLLSNAAGGIDPSFEVGDIMLIKDHISFIPNPLIGPNDDTLGPRFPSMVDAYSPRLREIASSAAAKLGVELKEGVYVAVTGPSYETPAEVRFYRMIGGDAVGMSTVTEVIAARHAGMEVMAASLITNINNPDNPVPADHDEVLEAGRRATKRLTALFTEVIAQL